MLETHVEIIGRLVLSSAVRVDFQPMDVAKNDAVGYRAEHGDEADVHQRTDEGSRLLVGDADDQRGDDAGQVRTEIENACGEPDPRMQAAKEDPRFAATVKRLGLD